MKGSKQQKQNTLEYSPLQLIIQMVFKWHSKNSRETSRHQTEFKHISEVMPGNGVAKYYEEQYNCVV